MEEAVDKDEWDEVGVQMSIEQISSPFGIVGTASGHFQNSGTKQFCAATCEKVYISTPSESEWDTFYSCPSDRRIIGIHKLEGPDSW